MPTLDELATILSQAWTPRADITMHDDLFVPGEPAVGQCAVTSLVVQDYFGGEILNTVVSVPGSPDVSASHYFNTIDGNIVDLTRQQFRDGLVFSEPRPKLKNYSSTREYMLSYPSTVERYEQLKANVASLLK